MIYRTFIEVSKKDVGLFEGLKTTIKARGKNSFYGTMFNPLFIVEEVKRPGIFRAMCTDGKRLHIFHYKQDRLAQEKGLEAGYWRVVREAKTFIQIALYNKWDGPAFPDVSKIEPKNIPKYTAYYSCQSLFKDGAVEHAKLIRAFPDLTAIDINYIQDLGNGSPWEIEWRGSKEPIIFKQKNLTAYVMPKLVEGV